MTRTTDAPASRRRRKRWIKRAKGFWGDRKNHIRLTKDAVMKALRDNYVHRKKRKSLFRNLWIMRISAAAKIEGISYNKLIQGLKLANCQLDRKMLSFLAYSDQVSFAKVVDKAKEALSR